jgi:hypothetical protein
MMTTQHVNAGMLLYKLSCQAVNEAKLFISARVGSLDAHVFPLEHDAKIVSEHKKAETHESKKEKVTQHVCDKTCQWPEQRSLSTLEPGGFSANGNM